MRNVHINVPQKAKISHFHCKLIITHWWWEKLRISYITMIVKKKTLHHILQVQLICNKRSNTCSFLYILLTREKKPLYTLLHVITTSYKCLIGKYFSHTWHRSELYFFYSQMAPALRSSGTKLPLRWRDMILSVDPMSLPPMNTAGTGGLRPVSLTSSFSMSFPFESLSSSYTVGLTPSSQKSLVVVWHMQHELTVKITTARWEANFVTRSIAVVVLSENAWKCREKRKERGELPL